MPGLGSRSQFGGTNIGFADGSVDFVGHTENDNPTLRAIATIDGGEEIDRSGW